MANSSFTAFPFAADTHRNVKSASYPPTLLIVFNRTKVCLCCDSRVIFPLHLSQYITLTDLVAVKLICVLRWIERYLISDIFTSTTFVQDIPRFFMEFHDFINLVRTCMKPVETMISMSGTKMWRRII